MDLSLASTHFGAVIDNDDFQLPSFPAPSSPSSSSPDLNKTTPDQFVCEVCSKKCVSRENLRNHRRHVHPKKFYSCSQCQKVFKSMSSLRRHASVHPDALTVSHDAQLLPSTDVYFCLICSKSFRSSSALNSHKNRAHGEMLFGRNDKNDSSALSSSSTVSNCAVDFAGIFSAHDVPPNLPVFPGFESFDGEEPVDLSKSHKASNTSTLPSPPTSIVSISPVTSKTVGVTILSIKNPDGTVSCGYCGKAFLSKSLLSYHRRNVHPSVLHSCQECGKAFKSKSHLRRHGRVHSGERPFPCGLCSRRYSDARHVREHQFKCHGVNSKPNGTNRLQIASDRSNICSICLEDFSGLNRLQRHVVKYHVRLTKRDRAIRSTLTVSCPHCRYSVKPPRTLGWHLRLHSRVKKQLSTK